MVAYGYRWLHMVTDGYIWLHMVTYRLHVETKDFDGF